MANCEVCGQDYLRCNCQSQQPYCNQCNEEDGCLQEMDSACVIYHPEPTTKPSKLENLGMPNNSTAEEIFEAIDDFLGNNANVPITPVDSPSIDLTATGVADHTIKADIKVSPDTLNQIEVRPNGVYAKPYNENYWVKVDAADDPNYLEEQIVGGSDGIVSVSIENQNGLLVAIPTLNIQALLNKIRDQFGDAFCELVSNCISYTWARNTYECQSEDLDLITQKTINNLPEPMYMFEDGGRLYFVSSNNTTGVVWSLDPTTATSVSDIVYLNETRSGTPYGGSGGTYVAGQPYKANGTGSGASTLVTGSFYDKPSRTLYVHSYRSYGCDYYDFTTNTWNKVSVGSTGSTYNTTVSGDIFTHIGMSSNNNTNLLLTGWGTTSGNRGRRVIVIDKSTKTITTQIDTVASPTFAGLTGTANPFEAFWGAYITSDNRIFVSRANVSRYRNIAVFNTSLTVILEIVPVNSNVGFNGSVDSYWQNTFMDQVNNKIYLNDYMSRKIEVYDTTTYALLKTFSLDNNRTYPTCQALFGTNVVTQELFVDLIYGGTSASSSDDAPNSQMVSYKIDRSTLDIKKIYIGTARATNLLSLTNGSIATSVSGDNNPTTPTSVGYAIFYQKNPSALPNGIVNVLTLKQINSNTGAPTGLTKPNLSTDPDYIASFLDTTLCPVSYTTAAPSNIIFTATDARYAIDFGLNDEVVKNPALASITAVIRNTTTSSTINTKIWAIPNTPNTNAFFNAVNVTGITAGDTITVDIIYKNASNVAIATYNNIITVTAIVN